MFELKDIRFKNILNIPSLKIAGGEITCLFGPSGCGKTTLLRMLNGMSSPDLGTILLDGHDLSAMDLVQLRRKVVMLPQQSTIFPCNVRDNLNMGALFQDRAPFPDEALQQMLTVTGLETKTLDESPAPFSGGEKQRLTLARVLLLTPPILLLDEPGSALDASMETNIMDAILRDHQARITTCILVTHSLEMAKEYSDTIVFMENGTIAQIQHFTKEEAPQ